ncbi:MAG: hypothetical protein SFU83_12265 [Meiothermus sp.]|nr:hypothetical protein [Meiothermus sp.]
MIDRDELIKLLEPRYPYAARQARDGAHLGMAELSHDTQDAIRAGDWALVQEHFDFVGQIFVEADDYVQNAIYVSYLEHVLLDRTSPLEMKARSLLPPVLSRALLGLEAHFKWLGGQRPTNHIYHFISGPLDLTQSEFDQHYKPAIDSVLAVCETEGFVVADASGTDTLAQQYLADKGAVVFVYHLLEAPRFNAGFPTKGGFTSDLERDAAMTLASDFEIAWVRPGREDLSTQQNLARCKQP